MLLQILELLFYKKATVKNHTVAFLLFLYIK